jgi:hypothetical protein
MTTTLVLVGESVSAPDDDDLSGDFAGYGTPAFTPIPTIFLRQQMTDLSLAERCVMLYIFAQTYGAGQPHAPVSFRALRHGRKIGGQPVDGGAGIDDLSVLDAALQSLTARGFLFGHPHDDARCPSLTTIYELNIDGEPRYVSCASQATNPLLVHDTIAMTRPAMDEPLADNREQARSLHDRIAADATAILQQLAEWGVSDSHARGLAALSAQRGDPPTYIADLLAYVTSVPDVQNPLALLDHLCRQGLSRSAPKHPLPAVPPYRYGTRPTTAQGDRLRQGWIARVQANPGLIRYSVEAHLRHPEDYATTPPLEETFPELADIITQLREEILAEDTDLPSGEAGE